MNKRNISMILTAAVLAGSLAGCTQSTGASGSDTGSSSNAKEVVIYTNADDEAIEAMKTTLDSNGYEGQYIFQTFGTSELGGKVLLAYQPAEMTNAGLSDSVYGSLLQTSGVDGIILIKDKGDALEIGFRAKNKSLLDVGKIAAALGGGGHRCAAGATITGYTAEEAGKMLLSMMAKELNCTGE